MPLPRPTTPIYELELPSTGETIKYRPFLVKEEKVLLIALESEDTKQITTAIKTVIKSCILTKNIKVEALPTFDIEYLFLNIRGKSVGESVDVLITCPDDGTTQVPISINLDDIKVNVSDDHSRDIKLDDVLTLSESYDIEMISMYQSYLRQSYKRKNNESNINRQMGYLSSVNDAKDILEKLYESS